VKQVKEMEGGTGSGREVAIQSLKVEKLELYQTLEVLLRDRNFKFLCSIEGIYRDDLVALIKAALRPISRKDANDQISHWIQIGVFEVELREVEFLMPKQLVEEKKKRRKKPRGYEVIGEEDGMVLLRTFKQFLTPTRELRAVCSVLEPGSSSSKG
jgi:hypothetical protein